MAKLETDGLQELLDFNGKLEHLPGHVIEGMLEAQAKILIKAQQAAAPKNTTKMAKAIAADKVRITKDGGYTYVYPKGVHHVSKKSRYRNGGGSRTVTNAEVAFIHEYGAPRRNIAAKQWIRLANEQCADEAAEAAQKVLDDYTQAE